MSLSNGAIHAVLSAFLHCSIVLMPLLFIARRYRARDAFTAAALTILLVLIDELVLELPKDLLAQRWNWSGKILESLWPLAAAFVFRLPKKFTAFEKPAENGAYLAAIYFGLALTSFHLYYFFQGQFADRQRCDFESILFQCTMPGLGEEVFYRGLLLGTLDRWLSRPWTVFGVKVGLGCLISSGIFVVAHVIEMTPDFKLSFCPDPIFYFFVAAVALSMCYLRYKTGSILPCVVAHNMVNGLRYIISAVRYMWA